MKEFWEGFMSIFGIWPRRSKRVEEILEQSKKPFTWYHEGPWWEHPIHGDAWKKKK